MVRPTKNSSTPVLPTLTTKQRRERTPKWSNVGQDQDIDPSDLSEECRALYVLLSRKIDSVLEEVKARDARLEKCELDNAALKKKVHELEGRLDDVENSNRGKNLILSGKTLSVLTSDNLANSVAQLLNSKIHYELSPNSILSVSRIGSRPTTQSPDYRNVMLKLHDGSIKHDIQSACRTVRPPDFYANDDLTPHRANLLYLLRQAKRKAGSKLVSCGSVNGSVYALIKPDSAARNQRVYIRSMDRLESLCSRELGISLCELRDGGTVG